MSQPEFNVGARAQSFRYAVRGIVALLRSQHNAWIHAGASVVVIALGIGLGLSRTEWCVIVLAIVLVWSAEAVNTAFEALCDVASPAHHPLVERAKDIAAGAVLIAAAGAALIGLLVFGPHVLRRLVGGV
jgi:diacylglycerol kinase (ATP)